MLCFRDTVDGESRHRKGLYREETQLEELGLTSPSQVKQEPAKGKTA
jgi:hypothetical protein